MYQRFGKLARPLTALLRKDCFKWTNEASTTFKTLQSALSTTLVLALPDFSKPFLIETDASRSGIGAVLMQDHHPIAFISKALGLRHEAMFVHERELLTIVYVVQKWGVYLSHAPFVIKNNQKSIKHILEQRLHTPF